MKTILPLAAVLVCVSCGVTFADEKSDAKSLLDLLAKVQAVLPPGWEAEIEMPSWYGSEAPTIRIRSADPLKVVTRIPGAKDDKGLEIQRVVEARFVATPMMSQEERAAAIKRNDEMTARREAFAAERMKTIERLEKSARPIPPENYLPKNDDEKRIVAEFAYLWMNTNPRELPTHHFLGLAFKFEIKREWPTEIVDTEKRQEFKTLMGDVHEIIVPY